MSVRAYQVLCRPSTRFSGLLASRSKSNPRRLRRDISALFVRRRTAKSDKNAHQLGLFTQRHSIKLPQLKGAQRKKKWRSVSSQIAADFFHLARGTLIQEDPPCALQLQRWKESAVQTVRGMQWFSTAFTKRLGFSNTAGRADAVFVLWNYWLEKKGRGQQCGRECIRLGQNSVLFVCYFFMIRKR